MRDLQLAKVPTWGPVFEVTAGIIFAGVLVIRPDRNPLTWLAIAAAVVSIVGAVRSTRMEVRLLDSHVRIVNFWRTIDIPLSDIMSVMPDKALPGRLSLLVSDVDKPIEVHLSPRSGQRREDLRKQLQQVLAAR